MSTERENWSFQEEETNEGKKSYIQNNEENGGYERQQRSYDQRSGNVPLYSASMDSDGQVKRKRPRVGDSMGGGYNNRDNYNNQGGGYHNRPQGGYGNRDNYDNQGGGYNRPQGGYGNQGGSYNNNRQQGGYGNRDNYGDQGGGYNRPQGGYNNNRPQGGYGNRDNYGDRGGGYNRPQGGYGNQGGGYNNNRPQGGGYGNQGGGYNNNRSQGGYGNQGGGYNNNRPQGGYGNRPQGGGYNNNRPQGGGYGNRPQGGGYNNNRPQRPGGDRKYIFQKPIRYKEDHLNPSDPIRLNKYLANAGVCSRREADEFIHAGEVKVNGEVVTELGTKITRGDNVLFRDQPVKLEQKVYVLLNKPKNCVTTTDDPEERMTVMNIVKGACRERIFPVGRLDRNTTGVLLLTNDGDLAAKLTHPKFLKKKIYHVWLDKPVTVEDMQKIAEGIELEDGEIHADAISYANEEDQSQVGIEIHSGRNRIVRRIFETLSYRVKRLDRVYFAGLTKKNLPRGKWRYLSEKEVGMLRMGAFE